MLKLYFDGSCDPNPGGIGAWGFVVKRDNVSIKVANAVLGRGEGMTNNVVEYNALIKGLTYCKMNHPNERIEIFGDSDLVVKMVSKVWGWKKHRYCPHKDAPHLLKLLVAVNSLLPKDYSIFWIPREENIEADLLSKNHIAH